MIEKVIIKNFKRFKDEFQLELQDGMNILVSDNNQGKSTILEAIHLGLSGIFPGKPIRNNLSQYLFNKEIVDEYLLSIKNDNPIELPSILIELYFSNEYPVFEGDYFSDRENKSTAQGVQLKIEFDEQYRKEYEQLLETQEIKSLPIEYYGVKWCSFARDVVTSRTIPIKSSYIDVGASKFSNGSDMYISKIMNNILDQKEKIEISQAFRKVKEVFSEEAAIKEINKRITDSTSLTRKEISLAVDLSAKSTWDGSLLTQLNDIPFDFVGMGEQAILKTELALSNNRTDISDIILIEEPECHISSARLNALLNDIKDKYKKQIIVTTHSSFVMNKLGIKNLILLNNEQTTKFTDLKSETQDFFSKISGYDTLRLILCKKAILVEGDSDELVIQRAYMDSHYGRLPIEDEIEVISVGLSFLRFLEIAEKINVPVSVVTDNDGNISGLQAKYNAYLNSSTIKICYEAIEYSGDLTTGNSNRKYNYNTLEPSLLRANNLEVLNSILGKNYKSDEDLMIFMRSNKTEVALKIFNASDNIRYPDYIKEAVEYE